MFILIKLYVIIYINLNKLYLDFIVSWKVIPKLKFKIKLKWIFIFYELKLYILIATKHKKCEWSCYGFIFVYIFTNQCPKL